MDAKLTLRLDDDLIRAAEAYAAKRGTSVSRVVAEYLSTLMANDNESVREALPPRTRRLRGILRGADLDEAAYRGHLEDRYR